MRKNLKMTLAGSALLLTAACSDHPAFSSLYQEAGGHLNGGTFGNATMHNTLAQTGKGNQQMVSLNQRFSAQVPTKVNFAFNSSVLDGNARAAIRQQANFMSQFPELRFRVYGHTDLVGSNAYNKSLGLRRAQAVVAELARNGISRSRLEAMVSYGETRPIVATSGPSRSNRRTVTEVSGFVGANGRGILLDGRYAEVIRREYIASAVPSSGVTATATASE